MSNYEELVKFRNKLINDIDCVIFEEDCQLLDRILDDLEQKEQKIAELEKQLENAIVPKFKIGQEVWVIKRIKQEIANGKIIKQYSYFNGGTPENLRNVNRWRIRLKNNSEVTKKEYEIFTTKAQAEEALKKLEEV